jgi:hypothetical protein
MTITISGAVTAYVGELAMVKVATAGDNGTFAIQTVTLVGSTTQITVVVPSSAVMCGSGCGNLILGTPILGFGPGNGNAYNAQTCNPTTNPCAAFGLHIKNLGFNCQNDNGCIGWQNLYAEEESGADSFVISNYSFVGFDNHGSLAQNFGPILNAEVYTGNGNTNCATGTTGAYLGDSPMLGLNGWTINVGTNSTCGSTPIAAVMLDAASTEVSNGHCENFVNCVLMGANNASASGQRVTRIGLGKPTTNVVHISGNNPGNSDYVISNIQGQSGTTAVRDDINSVTLGGPFVALYSGLAHLYVFCKGGNGEAGGATASSRRQEVPLKPPGEPVA